MKRILQWLERLWFHPEPTVERIEREGEHRHHHDGAGGGYWHSHQAGHLTHVHDWGGIYWANRKESNE